MPAEGRARRTAVVVFTRAPVPGRTKTRLVPLLGAEGAAGLHELLLLRTVRVARQAAVGPVFLYVAPEDGAPSHRPGYFDRFRPRLRVRVQRGTDLGERMHRAFAERLRCHPAVLLVGSDCPALRPKDLRAASLALLTSPRTGPRAVLAPAEDGGYPLIGLRRAAPRIFDGLPWGSDRIFALTRRRMAELRWPLRVGRTLWDVDRAEDVRRLHARDLSRT